MTSRLSLKTLPVLALLVAGAAQASVAPAPAVAVDLGPASGYSGFFFGNVTGAADVEGRLAVGGNMTTGFDVGYRNAYGSTAPSLVVGGNVNLNAGTIYNGPKANVDTNATIGPAAATWIPGNVKMGDFVYGGTLSSPDWRYGSATKNGSFIDFAGAYTQLSGLSAQLAGLGANGSWSLGGGGVQLVGDGASDLQVFNLGNTALKDITLSNIKAGAHIVINSTLSSAVFSGNLGGDLGSSTDGLAGYRDRVLFNLSNASAVQVNTFVNGSVLAVNAAVSGSGHLEGTLVANSLGLRGDGAKLELGYEPFVPTAPVPEPETWAMMAAGLLVIGSLARRRRIG